MTTSDDVRDHWSLHRRNCNRIDLIWSQSYFSCSGSAAKILWKISKKKQRFVCLSSLMHGVTESVANKTLAHGKQEGKRHVSPFFKPTVAHRDAYSSDERCIGKSVYVSLRVPARFEETINEFYRRTRFWILEGADSFEALPRSPGHLLCFHSRAFLLSYFGALLYLFPILSESGARIYPANSKIFA